jgi:hypothetical protein
LDQAGRFQFRKYEVQMTSDMAFECLLVSRDLGVVCAMNKVLKNFSITTNICFTSSKAADYLAGRTTDLIIVDWDDSTVGLLRSIQSSEDYQKPTILAVSAPNQTVSGVDVVLANLFLGNRAPSRSKTHMPECYGTIVAICGMQ